MSDKEFPLETIKPDNKLTIDIGPLIKRVVIHNVSKYRKWHMIQRTPNEIIIYDTDNPGKQEMVDVLVDRVHREEGPVG